MSQRESNGHFEGGRQAGSHFGHSDAYANQQYGGYGEPQNQGFEPAYDDQYYEQAYSEVYDQAYDQAYGEGYDPTVVYPQGFVQSQQPEFQEDPPKKKGKGPLIAAIILLVVGIGLIVAALIYFLNAQNEYSEGAKEYAGLQANVSEDASTGRPVVDFAALKSLNEEIVGWVQIPDTPVNYPVCQHDDNDYYLVHTFLDNYNLAGTVFMDARSHSALDDRTTVLYGHHLKNGEMFACIANYSDQEQFDQLGNVYYISDNGVVHVLTPLCCMVVSGYEVEVLQFDFADDASFTQYVQDLISRSRAVSPTATAEGVSHVYLLSTCSYERDNDRTILVCVDWDAQHGALADASGDLEQIQSAADEVTGYDEGGEEQADEGWDESQEWSEGEESQEWSDGEGEESQEWGE